MRLSLFVASFFLLACTGPRPEEFVDEPIVVAPEITRFERPPLTASAEWVPGGATAPFELTASDGSGLRIIGLHANVVIQEPLAFTQLHMTFANEENRVREGRFEIRLPDTAAIARLALQVGTSWQEAEVVERDKARATFEAYMHERPTVDPALMEPGAGHRYSARIFPIPALSQRDVIVSYSQPVIDGAYRLPLQGLPEIAKAEIEVDVHGGSSEAPLRFAFDEFQPTEDLVVRLSGMPETTAIVGDRFVAARVRPEGALAPEPVEALTVLVDTSASMQPRFRETLDVLHDVILRLDNERELELRVIAFDQEQVEIFAGSSADFRIELIEELFRRGTRGASDLRAAIAFAAGDDRAPRRMLLVSDGIATAGPGVAEIRALLRRLGRRGLERLDAMTPAGGTEVSALRSLVAGPLPRAGVVLPRDLDSGLAVERLEHASLEGVAVRVDGAKFSWPERLAGVHPGDDVLVYAELDAPPQDVLRIQFDGDDGPVQEIEFLGVERPLAERAVVGARLERIAAELVDAAGDLKRELLLRQRMALLSTQYRVVSDVTSLLVLESDAEYALFGLSRVERLDILAVDAGRVTTLGDAPKSPEIDPHEDIPPRVPADSTGHFLASPYGGAFAVGHDDEDVWGGLEGTIGLGDTGLIGSGGGGGTGTGYGRGSGGGEFAGRGNAASTFGGSRSIDIVGLGLASQIEAASIVAEKSAALAEAHASAPVEAAPAPKRRAPTGLRSPASRWIGSAWPMVSSGRAKTEGPLDAVIARRIARAHLNEIRFCQNVGLIRDPLARGTVKASFELAASGTVGDVEVETSGTVLRGTRECIGRAVARWRFPSAATWTRVELSWALDSTTRRGWPKAPRRATSPHEGSFAAVQAALRSGATTAALERAESWASEHPSDLVALLALGDAYEAAGRESEAARAFGSIIDLHPDRADLRRVAGERLQRLASGRALAIDTFAKAISQRPEQLGGYRLLAMALLEDGEHARAFAILEDGIVSSESGRQTAGVRHLLAEDLELVAAVWAAREPSRAASIDARLQRLELARESSPSARVVLHWETDASDVDLHVVANDGRDPEVMVDVDDGYGPEFAIARGELPRSVRVRAHHYDRGPVGYAAGTLQVIVHDGNGALRLESKPYLLMRDRGLLDLGTFEL